MTAPKLSVIVPNYNHGKYLPTSLRGILQQSAPPHEVIVIDDASTDNSMEVLTEFQKQHPTLRVYRNEKNQGVVYGLNRGTDLATGDYLFFPAADDEVQAGLFEKSMHLLADHPSAALCCTGSKWHDMATGLSWHMAMEMAEKPAFITPAEMVKIGRQGKLLIVSSSAIFRKQPLIEAGKFIPELRWHCDWYATYVTAFRYGFCYVPEPLSDFYLHPTSYYHRGRKGSEHRQVLTDLLDRLTSPQNADLAGRVRDSAALALFEFPLLRLLLAEPKYRFFLTPTLASRGVRRAAEVYGRKMLPKPVAKAAVRILYPKRTLPST